MEALAGIRAALADGGAVMRPDTLRRHANEAGFTQVEILPIDNELFRFYLLRG